MTKHLIYFHLFFLSTLCASDMVKVKLKSGHIGRGEWIGTYSGHVHLLIEDNVYYYACNEILSVMVDDKTNIEEAFVFDCSENSVSSDILFPPEIDPMTGEWTQNIPDIFNPNVPKQITEVKTQAVEIDNSVNSREITETPAKIEESTFWIDNEEKTPNSPVIAKKEKVTEQDFIIINGVKYVKASTGQNNLPRSKERDYKISEYEIRDMARRDATRNHNNITWNVAGLGGCVTGMFGAVVGGGLGDFPGFILGGFGGLLLPFSFANSFNPKIYYPKKIRGLDQKKLYKETYLLKARLLARDSMKSGPGFALLAGGAFLMLINL
tara:strand:- start:1178 stop:2149 length:972 start_codon:yes stop_codon:yes gene_type:complete